MIRIILTALLVAALLVVMSKKLYNITSIMLVGIVAMIIYTLVTGESVMAKPCGEGTFAHILDVFEFAATAFTSAFSNPGLLIVVLVGYSAYMKEIGASEMLVTLACTPLRKIKNPYIICGFAIVVAALIKAPITSPSGWSALMMITMFPILVNCGVNPITAAAAIALAQGCDWGPGDMGTGIIIPVVDSNISMSDYFLTYNFPTYMVIIPVLGIVAPIIYSIIDKKEGIKQGLDASIEVKSIDELEAPKFYALFPLLPVIFVLLFSKIGLKTIVMTTQGATLLSFFLVLFVEVIRKPKDFVGAITRTKSYFVSMGNAFATVVVLVASANCFAKAIGLIGGFTILTDLLASTGLSQFVLVGIIAILACLTTALSSSYNTAAYTFSPSLASVAASYGISTTKVMLPLQALLGYGRILCPINASHLIIAGTAGVDIGKLIKRNILCVVVAYVVIMVMYAIL